LKTITTMAAQGDVMFRKVASIPSDAKEMKKGDQIVVGHSETGHHHVAVGDWLRWFQHPSDPTVAYLQVDTKADIVHHRDFDTHETVRLDAGNWEIRRQREWSPEGWRMVQD
jgi:hypothetical protein